MILFHAAALYRGLMGWPHSSNMPVGHRIGRTVHVMNVFTIHYDQQTFHNEALSCTAMASVHNFTNH